MSDIAYSHSRWVSEHLKRDLTEPQAYVVNALCDGIVPPYRGGWGWDRAEWLHFGVIVPVLADLSTYDNDALTRLVIVAHARAVRICITPRATKWLAISATKRDRGASSVSAQHPTLAHAVETHHALAGPWCIRIPGPDDLFAAASLEDAKRMAEEHNRAIVAMLAKRPLDELDPPVSSAIAVVEPWPWSAEAHAAALAKGRGA